MDAVQRQRITRWHGPSPVLAIVALTLLSAQAAAAPPTTFRQLQRELNEVMKRDGGTLVVFCDGQPHMESNIKVALDGQVAPYLPVAPALSTGPMSLAPSVYCLETSKGEYRIWIRRYRSRSDAFEYISKTLEGRRLPRTATSVLAYPVYPEPPRHFLAMKWDRRLIGEYSFGKRFGGWEGHALYAVTFLTGNLVITVEGYPQGDVETPLDPDPREIAFKLDRYYSSDPTAELPAEEKARRRTLSVKIGAAEEIVTGREYRLIFPLTSADQGLTEIRLRVTGGEIWEVPREPAEDRPGREWISPDRRDYFVKFYRPGKRTIACYHINSKGECTAWGELTVDVKEAP
ncbi:MAG: hypothetical protein GYA33_02620 [Thermogutta sp.]|nr:hypothetical protein [Thermogutta sp.]